MAYSKPNLQIFPPLTFTCQPYPHLGIGQAKTTIFYCLKMLNTDMQRFALINNNLTNIIFALLAEGLLKH